MISSPRQRLEGGKTKRQYSQIGNEEEEKCIVCIERIGEMVNYPCGHGGLCEVCATEIFQKR